MDERGYVNPTTAGAIIDRSPRTLADWRIDGRGPRYYRVNGRVLYAVADLRAWVEGRAPTGPQSQKPEKPRPPRGFAKRRAQGIASATAAT